MLVAADDDKLEFIDTPLDPIRRAVGVMRPADRPLSPGARALLTHLRRQATGLDPDRL
jgi:hypothetical protein